MAISLVSCNSGEYESNPVSENIVSNETSLLSEIQDSKGLSKAEQSRLREESKLKEESKFLERSKAEQSRLLEESRLQEESRLLEESKLQEQSKLQEESRLREQSRLLEESRLREQSRLLEESRLQEESKLREQSRLLEESRLREESRLLEESKLRQESLQNEIYNAQNSIQITNCSVSKPNSVGGIDVHIDFYNRSGKTIKYVYYQVQAYNAVNDPVSCEIRGNSISNLKFTGPVEPYTYSNDPGIEEISIEGMETPRIVPGNTTWDCVWYNYSIKYCKLINVSIDYMDGTSINISEENISYLY